MQGMTYSTGIFSSVMKGTSLLYDSNKVALSILGNLHDMKNNLVYAKFEVLISMICLWSGYTGEHKHTYMCYGNRTLHKI